MPYAEGADARPHKKEPDSPSAARQEGLSFSFFPVALLKNCLF